MEHDPLVTIQFTLGGGFWLQPRLGVWYVEDEGPNSPFRYLHRLKDIIGEHQPLLGFRIRSCLENGTTYTDFWEEVATDMIIEGDWLLAWRGTIFVKKADLAAVKALIGSAPDGIPLQWPEWAEISILGIHGGSRCVIATWGELLGNSSAD
jgi:hypothetical protein